MKIATVRILATNRSDGPRGVNLAQGGTAAVARGATSAELLVTQGELESMLTGGSWAVERLGPGEDVFRQETKPQRTPLSDMKGEIRALRADVDRLLPLLGEGVEMKSFEGEAGQFSFVTQEAFDELRSVVNGLAEAVTALTNALGGNVSDAAEPAGEQPGQADPGPMPTPQEVIAMASDGRPYHEFKAEAERLLGAENTPAKKVEILAALQARADGQQA